ncbi:MAG: HAD family hydrolase, partial [Bacillota bacterium]|nr:HAD family hydrolase [Bacillota bacterium]
MSQRAVIFDLDGTLVDTLQDLADAANRALQEHGLTPLPVQDYRYLVGAGAKNLMTRCAAASGAPKPFYEEQIGRMTEAFKAAYQENWHVSTRPYPGISSLLERLADTDLKLAVLSNKPDAFTQQVADWYFPDKPFLEVMGQIEGIPIKPDPAGALLLCRKLGCKPEDAVLVGDTGTDMETAVRAGMIPAGVLWGFREAGELKAGGAQHLFASPDDLVTWLLAFATDCHLQS